MIGAVREAGVKAVCAVLSIITAAALIAVMPTALRMISPRERQLKLEAEVTERTRENGELVREINHRLGNQLQIMSSAVRIERRRAGGAEELKILQRLSAVVDDLAREYHEVESRYSALCRPKGDPEAEAFPATTSTGIRAAS